MDEKQYYLPDQENHFISGHAMNKLLRRADGNAALLYLYILRQRGRVIVPQAMRDLHLTEQEVYDGLAVLATLGLVSGKGASPKEKKREEPEREEPIQYTAADIEREMKENSSFASLVGEVGHMLGKILTTSDMTALLGLHHQRGLPVEVIYQLVDYVVREHQAQFGQGQYPTMRKIEKEGYSWARQGVFTLDEAMELIARREVQRSEMGRIKKVMDIRQDKLTPTQEKYMTAWLDMGFGAEVIALAYDKTVVATGGLKWNYMDKILSNWHEKNLLTAQAIDRAEGGRRRGKNGGTKAAEAPVPDRQEIERRKRLIDQMKVE